ncbi:hypothetical protein J2S13_002008 [Oikeobacillus pervagus]|uniref:Extracellular membrane-anchored protein n=1 Tax=Oikeobacillus pervagus TaxID=1325931 RepID=A0AAJ1SZ89_9BACI|nr:hypothetical protein [Oikeobacillus pervagus]MDQ0215590.1 hypothetical protein [Oikeobacillus pervagus]
MSKLPWNVFSKVAVVSALFLAGCGADQAKDEKKSEKETAKASVKVTDYTFDTAANMFAYSEFELSGEPLAEGLGLDLDVLDPQKVNKPTKFDYTAGIESYEYSEEAMYEVVEKSGFGLHLVHGPAIQQLAKKQGKQPEQLLGERFYSLADAVGYPREEIFSNMYPTFMEYSKGDPHYAQKVDTKKYAENDDGTYVPKYQVNFESLRWDRDKMEKALVPSAYGSVFLKQALWAGDFLGGFHTVDGDEELAGETPKDDEDQNIALGVSSADGMQGMILTEEIWNKLLYIRNHLFYDSKTNQLQAAKMGVNYDPAKGLVYLPHQIAVTEDGNEAAAMAKQLKVTDAKSVLNDQWLMLWPSAEFFGMTDQRPENKNVAPSFQALFDGDPFPQGAGENIDSNANNDITADDPYSVNRDIMLHVFKNIRAMHFNNKEGVFVHEHDGKQQGTYVDTFEAGYTMEALRIFQRAIDGLPVGYASGEAAKGLETEEGKLAIDMIRKQADFMLTHLVQKDGLVASGYEIGKGVKDEVTLKAQLGAIRGLTAAFLATEDEKYREAARELYVSMEKEFYDKELKILQTKDGEIKYDPTTAGALSAVFRVAIQNLSNRDNGEQEKALEIETITKRYTDFYDLVIDGPNLKEGMQTSEFWDTGDVYKEKDRSENTDGDTVPQVQAGHGKYGIAPVLVPVEVKKR